MFSKRGKYLFVILLVLLVLFLSSLTDASNGNYIKSLIVFILACFVGYLYYLEIENNR